MKTTSILLAATLVLPALPGHAASLEILSGFDGMQEGTISRSNSVFTAGVTTDRAINEGNIFQQDTESQSENTSVVRDGDAVTIDSQLILGVGQQFRSYTGPLTSSDDGRIQVTPRGETGLDVRITNGDQVDVPRSIDITFSIDAPYAFEFDGSVQGSEITQGSFALLSGTADPERASFGRISAENVIAGRRVEINSSFGEFREVTVNGEVVSFLPFVRSRFRERSVEAIRGLIEASPVLDPDPTFSPFFDSTDSFSGVLQPGEYRLLSSTNFFIDGASQSNGGSTSISFSARPVSQGPTAVPTPSALAGGMVGALALLRRRRRG